MCTRVLAHVISCLWILRLHSSLIPWLERALRGALVKALLEGLLRCMPWADASSGWVIVGVWVVWWWGLGSNLTLIHIRRGVMGVTRLFNIGHPNRGRGAIGDPRGVRGPSIDWALWHTTLHRVRMTASQDDLDLHSSSILSGAQQHECHLLRLPWE